MSFLQFTQIASCGKHDELSFAAGAGSDSTGRNCDTALAGQTLGIKEVDEGIRLISFMHYDLGYNVLPSPALATRCLFRRKRLHWNHWHRLDRAKAGDQRIDRRQNKQGQHRAQADAADNDPADFLAAFRARAA